MALPTMATGLVVGQYVVPGGAAKPRAAQGIIEFTASVPYNPIPTASPNAYTIVPMRVVGVLDAEGFVCTPLREGSTEPGAQGVRLPATDGAQGSVAAWTWTATPKLTPPEGVRASSNIEPFTFGVPAGKTTDLATVAKVPASSGSGTEQIVALAAAASRSAIDAAASANEVKDKALANDAGVANLLKTGAQTSSFFKAAIASAIQQAFDAIPADGYDIVLLMGQSNMQGAAQDFTPGVEPDEAPLRAYQYGSPFAAVLRDGAGKITPATDPLIHRYTTGNVTMGPGIPFAREYIKTMPSDRRLLLVPAAFSGTGFGRMTHGAEVDLTWRADPLPGSKSLLEDAITQTKRARTAAGGTSRVVAAFWVQGESDETQIPAAYQGWLDALIAKLRNDLGEPELPFIIGSMVPEGLVGNSGRAAIDAVHKSTPDRVPYTAFVSGVTGRFQDSGLHYNAAGHRIQGPKFVAAIKAAKANVPAVPRTFTELVAGSSRAYSLRKLGAYNGPAIRVRRTDLTETNIGFVGNSLDTAALLEFAGSGQAFIHTWYDQSGNGWNLTQTTEAAQARLVNMGEVDTVNGRPWPIWSVSTYYGETFTGTARSMYAAGATTIAMLHRGAASANGRVVVEASSTVLAPMYAPIMANATNPALLSQRIVSNDGSDIAADTATRSVLEGAAGQITVRDTGGTIEKRANGSSAGTVHYARTRPITTDRFALGALFRSNGSQAFAGVSIPEILIWHEAISDTERNTVEANQKTFFSTP